MFSDYRQVVAQYFLELIGRVSDVHMMLPFHLVHVLIGGFRPGHAWALPR